MSNDKEEKKSDSFTPEEPETEIRDDKENIHRESVMEDQSEAQAAMPDDDAEDADDTAEEILDDDAENDDTAEDIQDDNTEREDEADKMSESTKKKTRRRRRR